MTVKAIGEDVKQNCIDVLRHLPNPVSIVTTWVDDRPWGVTVSSFLPVTMDPPKVMVSLFSHTLAAKEIMRQGFFGVSLLHPEQQIIAETVSKPGAAKFIDDFTVPSREGEAPVILGSSHFSCDLDQAIEIDDHVILIGRVIDVKQAPTASKLIYANRAFHHFGD